LPRYAIPGRFVLADSRGLSTVEYVIILALVCVVGFVVWQQFGGHAAEGNRAAGHVVNGLATSSHEGDGAAPTATGAPATGAGEHPDLRAASEVSTEPEGTDVWKLFLVGGLFFGAMILWLMKQKSSR
jgi:hypothetical protein